MAWYDYIPSPALQIANALKGGHPFGIDVGKIDDESQSAIDKRNRLNEQGAAAGGFADQGERGFGALGAEAQQSRDYLRRLASGQESVAQEQLRQGLQQGMSAQRSMAAGASPQNQAMAARNAAMNMGRMSAGMSGQAAMAGIEERKAAQQALANMILQQRGQDLQAALGSRQTAVGAYGGVTPDKSLLEKWSGPVAGGLAAGAQFSDRRLKEDIEDGDLDANAALKGLRAYAYKYKDQSHGKGKHVGVMAQDLERAGLKHTVFETPVGKAVDGARLATTNTALLAALEKRVSKIEGGPKAKKG